MNSFFQNKIEPLFPPNMFCLIRHIFTRWNFQTLRVRKGSICFFSPLFDEQRLKDGFFRRVKAIDDVFIDSFKIYIHTEDRKLRCLEIKITSDLTASVGFSSASTFQKIQVVLITLLVGRIYIHSVAQLGRYILSIPFIVKCVDLHGAMPEEFHMQGDQLNELLAEKKERRVAQKADIIVTVTDAMTRHFRKKHRVNEHKIVVTLPIFEERLFTKTECKPYAQGRYINNKPIIVYAGGVQKWQLIPLMQEVINNTANKAIYKLYFPDPSAFLEQWHPTGESCDVEIGSKSAAELIEILGQCHFGLLLREYSVVNQVACPTKLIEYISHGIVPILLSPHIGDFYEMGLQYLDLSEFLAGRIPTERQRDYMAMHNKEVLAKIQEQYYDGKRILLAKMSS